jgi:hypothetical protein
MLNKLKILIYRIFNYKRHKWPKISVFDRVKIDLPRRKEIQILFWNFPQHPMVTPAHLLRFYNVTLCPTDIFLPNQLSDTIS